MVEVAAEVMIVPLSQTAWMAILLSLPGKSKNSILEIFFISLKIPKKLTKLVKTVKLGGKKI